MSEVLAIGNRAMGNGIEMRARLEQAMALVGADAIAVRSHLQQQSA